ncbi:E3 ubiquitin-protein ligase RNF139 [Antennarius striatus]|uniref:E3 ubiquitin-protein ligase RNF139 n=1 Tax=Antennarius striatus TaxID=241820 RepID=UPI0035B34181
MATPQARLGRRAVAVLEVALRVPCVFMIDAIFNCDYDPGPGWTGATGRLLLRAAGVLVSGVVLLLSQKALFRFYTLLSAVVLGVAAVLFNYYATSHADTPAAPQQAAPGARLLPGSGPALWLGVVAVQLLLGVAYALLLRLRAGPGALVVLGLLAPLWGLAAELPADARRLVALGSGVALAVGTGVSLAPRLTWFYYSCRYVCLLLRHMYRIYGLQLLLEDTWRRLRLPAVLRLFWLTRLVAQALILVYVMRAARREGTDSGGGAGEASDTQGPLLSWDVLWDVTSSLVIAGCDSTLTVLGMSAVISSVAHHLGLGILAFIGSTEEEDKRLGFVAPVLFFILALQTGLSGLDPEERLVRLSRNLCLLLTAILHFIHGMADPVLMSLGAAHVASLRRHAPVLLVSLALFVLPVALSHALWRRHTLNTWLFAVTAFCVELCLKVLVSLVVYVLFLADGAAGALWERLDDYVYYVRAAGGVLELVFGVLMFGNGAYTMAFEAGSKIRAVMMCLHAYFNIYLQARAGWRTFRHRRSAVRRIQALPELRGVELRGVEDVCAICYQELAAARVTPCRHYFHALCLRKWLYIQDTCPMCHQRLHTEGGGRAPADNNGGYAAPRDAAPPAPDRQQQGPPAAAERPTDGAGGGAEPEDNDSIEYDEDEWGPHGGGGPPEEDDYDTDSAHD